MKIILLVPDGVAVRNYIYSDFLVELKNNGFEIILYHKISSSAIEEIKNLRGNFVSQFIEIPDFKENFLSRIIRESIVFARLRFNTTSFDNNSIMLFWNRNQKGFKRLALLRICEIFGFILSKKYSLILKFEKIYEKLISKSNNIGIIEKELEFLKPDYILNLHQRAVITAPIINYAKQHSIQTGTVIFSWDNVPKARLISRYDDYFVWSDLMKTELKIAYPEINIEKIKIAGTPQFEFYFKNEFIKSKVDFFNEYGLDINKKTICFSSNDTSSPYEQIYFADLCNEILKCDENKRPQILFRKCPVDKTSRFDKVVEKYKDLIISIEPDWRVEKEGETSFIEIYPSYNDISLLTNTVLHSDLVINLGSTMAHDFAIYDKPCIYLNYNPVENSIFKVEDVYAFQHFKSMKNIDAVSWINNKSEFLPVIEKVLLSPENSGKDRLKWLQKIVQHPIQENSKNLAKEITKCISV